MKAPAAIVALAGCASFEDPAVVHDLRVLGMTMLPTPERVIDLDFRAETPPTTGDVLALLARQPTPRVCALVADPMTTSDLRYSMRACIADEGGRCDPARPAYTLVESATLDDPEVWAGATAGQACADIPVDGNFVGLLYDALQASPQSALVGVDFAVELRIGRQTEHPEHDVFAVKKGRVSARIPSTREPNHNPELLELQISIPDGAVRTDPQRSCAQPFGEVAAVRPGAAVLLYPSEAPGTRERFTTPTLDGDFLEVDEFIEYRWFASRGSFSPDETGGPPDVFGNEQLLGTDWIAPQVATETNVSIWALARDARYGVTWWETCIKVVP